MAKKHKNIGKLPPRYSFLLNPHAGTRLSRCPICEKPTHARKFPLFIIIEGWGPFVLGKTCKYCTPCELIMVHQDELEAELVIFGERYCPDAIGNPYHVIGTTEKATWKAGLDGGGPKTGSMLDHLADFKKHFDLEFDPGGWRFG